MEPMITGSPNMDSLNTSNIGNHSQSFLPGYLLGSGIEKNMPANTPERSYNKQQNRVTWSPELDKTTYYEKTGSVPSESGMDSFSAWNRIPTSPLTTNNSGGGPPVRTLLHNNDANNQSTSTFNYSSTWHSVDNNISNMEPLDFTPKDAKKDAADCCVTVFGLIPESVNFIMQQFSQCGTIEKYEAPNKCNWIHLKFMSRMQAVKALENNGRILNGCMQIGVMPCINEEVLNRFLNIVSVLGQENTFFNETKLQYASPIKKTVMTNNGLANYQNVAPKSNMRLLTANNVETDALKKCVVDEGILAKAKHYFLGW